LYREVLALVETCRYWLSFDRFPHQSFGLFDTIFLQKSPREKS